MGIRVRSFAEQSVFLLLSAGFSAGMFVLAPLAQAQSVRSPSPTPSASPSSPSPRSSPSPSPTPSSAPLTIFENVTLSPAFSPDPTMIRGISGGAKTASELTGRAETITGPCNGFVDTQPDHTIVLTQFFSYLSLQVQSSSDTTLVIRGPGGTWCNDDYSGKNPGIAGQWLSGKYEIWVGSYDQNGYYPYVIHITEQKQEAQQAQQTQQSR